VEVAPGVWASKEAAAAKLGGKAKGGRQRAAPEAAGKPAFLAALEAQGQQVRKMPRRPSRWADVSRVQLCSHGNAGADLHLLGRPNTLRTAPALRGAAEAHQEGAADGLARGALSPSHQLTLIIPPHHLTSPHHLLSSHPSPHHLLSSHHLTLIISSLLIISSYLNIFPHLIIPPHHLLSSQHLSPSLLISSSHLI
jgi:hypothetical protein